MQDYINIQIKTLSNYGGGMAELMARPPFEHKFEGSNYYCGTYKCIM
jgi:hypothetical protein